MAVYMPCMYIVHRVMMRSGLESAHFHMQRHSLTPCLRPGNALASMHSGIPLLLKKLSEATSKIDCVAFPDEGACKRFSYIFAESFPDWPIVICGKVRSGVVIPSVLFCAALADARSVGRHYFWPPRALMLLWIITMMERF